MISETCLGNLIRYKKERRNNKGFTNDVRRRVCVSFRCGFLLVKAFIGKVFLTKIVGKG